MAKRVLELKDFTVGINCYSDSRDIQDNQFSRAWNANVGQSGIIKLSGLWESYIKNLPHGNSKFQAGYGLFETGVDYSISIIDGEFENGFEQGLIQGYNDEDATGSGSSGEILNNTGDFSSNWTGGGDFSDLDGTDATYTHSSGAGTLTQTSFLHTPTVSTYHKLEYTISGSPSGDKTTITLKGGSGTNYFADADIVLHAPSGTTSSEGAAADGTYKVYFKAFTTISSFQIAVVTTSGASSFNLDNISVKQIAGIQLAALSTHQTSANHATNNYYNNYCIFINSGTGSGQVRRIDDYTGITKVAVLDSNFGTDPTTGGSSAYKIFRWAGDGDIFGNQSGGTGGGIDYIDNAGSDSVSNDDIEHFNPINNGGYFLRTKTATITDAQSKNLGFITYLPNNSTTWSNNDTDADIGNLNLVSGTTYCLSFWCKTSAQYYGYVSDANYSERVPFVQLYSHDGNYHLFQTNSGTKFMQGAEATYDFADDLTKNWIANGDFEEGTATGGDGGQGTANGGADASTYDPPTGWTAYDGYIANTNNAITYSYITGANSYGADSTGTNGATLNMAIGSAFSLTNGKPNCYMFQDIVLNDNQWYELFFTYSSSASGISYAVYDIQKGESGYADGLHTTGILAAEAKSQSDGAVVLNVDTVVPTDELVLNKELFKKESDNSGTFLGVATAWADSSTDTITFTGGTNAAISNNDELYTASSIIPWTSLPHTGGVTTYEYIKRNVSDFPSPHKFYVKDNGGTPRKIRVYFSGAAASTNVRFDGITVRKSFPDLLSMGESTNIGNPYSPESQLWSNYKVSFTVPSTQSDWVLRLNGGSYGYQAGANDSQSTQTVYFGGIKLESENHDNLLFLNDNTDNESEISVYSYNSGNWLSNLMKFSPNLKPVYNYINGFIKISDANFESGNLSQILYYTNRTLLGDSKLTKGWKIATSPLSEPPPIFTISNGEIQELSQTYNALYFNNKHTFGNLSSGNYAKQFLYEGSKATNWPLGDLGGGADGGSEINDADDSDLITNARRDIGRILFYQRDRHGYNGGHSNYQLWSPLGTPDTSSGDELTTAYDEFNYGDGSQHNYDYLHNDDWAGGDGHLAHHYLAWPGEVGGGGSDEDMGSKISGAHSVSRVKIKYTYGFSAAERGADSDGDGPDMENMVTPYHRVYCGKLVSPNIFSSSENPSDADKKTLSIGGTDIQYDKKKEFTFYDNDEIIDYTFDDEYNIRWQNSTYWPWSTMHIQQAGDADHAHRSEKTYEAEVSYEPGEILVTNNMILKHECKYPDNNFDGWKHDLWDCMLYRAGYNLSDSSDWDFPRYERVIWQKVQVYFYSTAWNNDQDGLTQSDNGTSVSFNFGTPSGATASGWEERIFKLGVTSVNYFDEESWISEADIEVGSNQTTATDSNTSIITNGQSPDVTVYIGDLIARDEYRTKLKYYMQDTESKIWYLQFYVDLKNNKIHSTTSNYTSTGIENSTAKVWSYSIPKEKILNYNDVDSYESQTLVNQDIALNSRKFTCKYKASVVANNRLYVGNIHQDNQLYEDRMIKSPIGKYNILPQSNFIDVAINDGDEIIDLQYYKDKLLQFKRNKVFVINISGDYEFLEDTFENCGITLPCSVTKTPKGIVWVNSTGCYLYDGQQLINLIDNIIPTTSDESFVDNNYWILEDNENKCGIIGYNHITKDIVIKKHITDESVVTTQPDGYVYNMPTKSWHMTMRAMNGLSISANTGNSSNFILNKDGYLLQYLKTSTLNDIVKWNPGITSDSALATDNSVSANNRLFLLTTKDFTFGDIATRKKIYKVYVSFKSIDKDDAATHSLIKVYYAINGSASFTQFDDSSTNYSTTNGLSDGGSSTTWITAELIPSSSINNIYSFQLQFEGTSSTPSKFAINDISIVYRSKGIK